MMFDNSREISVGPIGPDRETYSPSDYELRAPRDLYVAFDRACNRIHNLYNAFSGMLSFVSSILDGNEVTEQDKASFNSSLCCFSEQDYFVVFGRYNTLHDGDRAYLMNEEYFGAVSEKPVKFYDCYYHSFFDMAYSIEPGLRYLGELGALIYDDGWEWWRKWSPFQCKDPWENFPEPEWKDTRTISPEILDYLNSVEGQFTSLQEELLEGLKNVDNKDLKWVQRRICKALKVLKSAKTKMRIQFFKAWKTLSWPDDYETIIDRPFVQEFGGLLSCRSQSRPGGRPRKYDDLLEMFEKSKWKDEKLYYNDLCNRDDPAVKNHRGETISFRAFQKGLNDARARTKTDE